MLCKSADGMHCSTAFVLIACALTCVAQPKIDCHIIMISDCQLEGLARSCVQIGWLASPRIPRTDTASSTIPCVLTWTAWAKRRDVALISTLQDGRASLTTVGAVSTRSALAIAKFTKVISHHLATWATGLDVALAALELTSPAPTISRATS